MKKTTTIFSAQLVTFETSVPFAEFVARLDRAVNKEGSDQIISKLKGADSREKLEKIVNDIRGGNDFLYFSELNHHRWLSVYEGKPHPAIVVYTIGNPLIAQTIVKHDVRAALNIPPRLLIVEDPERHKTSIIYQLPSSVMVLVDDPNLRGAAKALDLKLENLLTRVARCSDKSRL
ncbi:hypothetical protein AX14_005714 [Amanita brunnescens Koide BX004]|nr:hypothetical protein AX14_005714 [Amanita brunnescens Koide BX004]